MSISKPSLVAPMLVVGALSLHAAIAADYSPESRVSQVTVYRQGALVTREARLTLAPGSHRVILTNLPCVADPDSVRASGTGTVGIEIGGVEVEKEFRKPDLTPDYRQIEQDLADLDRQKSLLDDRERSIETLHEFLASLKATAGTESSKEILSRGFAVESWQKAFDFLSTRLDDLSREARAMEATRKDLGERTEVARGSCRR